MYALRRSAADPSQFEELDNQSLRAVPPPPPIFPTPRRRADRKPTESGEVRSLYTLERTRASETTAPRSNGSRLLSFVPGPTAAPLTLAAGLATDVNATHRPTGDTSPPVVHVPAPVGPTLQRLFSAAVMDTLPGYGAADTADTVAGFLGPESSPPDDRLR